MTKQEINDVLNIAQSLTDQMDTAHLQNLLSVLLSTQQSNRCVFFSFLSLKLSVKYLISKLIKSKDAINLLNYRQVKCIYKILSDYNYYPRCKLCNQLIDTAIISHNKRNEPDNPLSFSWDHIFPKSHGGATCLYNLQPTHKICNNKKSDTIVYTQNPPINIRINIQISGNKYKTLRPKARVR